MTVLPRRGAAVLGAPVAHSLSPVLHEAAYRELGLDGWSYAAVECDEEGLRATLERLEADGLAGVSLTMPLKRAVMPMLARTDRIAADVDAANTVLFGGVDGDWWGANTDVPGMVTAIGLAQPPPWRPGDVAVRGDVCILGGGATAASALAALRELGVAECDVCVRRTSASRYLEEVGERVGVRVVVRAWDAATEVMPAAELVISTTPAGATDALASLVRPASDAMLFDVVYAPWPTPLAAAWEAAGGRVLGGLALLVHQAAIQVRLMTGEEPPVEVMMAAGEEALRSR